MDALQVVDLAGGGTVLLGQVALELDPFALELKVLMLECSTSVDLFRWPPQYGTPPLRAVMRALPYHSSSSRKRPA